jgi:hypothetical protein
LPWTPMRHRFACQRGSVRPLPLATQSPCRARLTTVRAVGGSKGWTDRGTGTAIALTRIDFLGRRKNLIEIFGKNPDNFPFRVLDTSAPPLLH